MKERTTENGADGSLVAHCLDLLAAAESGRCGISDFLSPAERISAETAIRKKSPRPPCFAFGGSENAERTRLCFYADWLDCGSLPPDEAYALFLTAQAGPETVLLSVKGSGFASFSHRDVLGSVLSLGIERSAVGDIFVREDGKEAFLFLLRPIADFLLAEWKTVGRDTVKVREVPLDTPLPLPKAVPLSDTVASARLDCVVSSLASLSRSDAVSAILRGDVAVDWQVEEKPDKILLPPCTLSVRGVGKFRLLRLSDVTKKGRLRLVAEKYQ